MDPVNFQIEPMTIYSFGVFRPVGALMAVWILQLELKRGGHDTQVAATLAHFWRETQFRAS
jgi:prolipoprotein diacylglyceryltransferase